MPGWRETVHRVLHALRYDHNVRGPIVIAANSVQWFFGAAEPPRHHNDNERTKP